MGTGRVQQECPSYGDGDRVERSALPVTVIEWNGPRRCILMGTGKSARPTVTVIEWNVPRRCSPDRDGQECPSYGDGDRVERFAKMQS